jgi:hypothetical protein
MPEMFYSLALLACPVGMGAMMWFMMRGGKHQPATPAIEDAELSRMRAEIDKLRAAQQAAGTPGRERLCLPTCPSGSPSHRSH